MAKKINPVGGDQQTDVQDQKIFFGNDPLLKSLQIGILTINFGSGELKGISPGNPGSIPDYLEVKIDGKQVAVFRLVP